MSSDARIASIDDVSLALHDYNPESLAPAILFSHATGFHGRVFDPIARELTTTHHCVTFDYRGHGDSTLPSDWRVRWSAYGDDALAAARHAASNGPVIGVGHSMGGAALIMAALRAPELFRALVLFEPIIFPPIPPETVSGSNQLANGARKRRATFPSFEDALANYSSKSPLNAFHPDALYAYVMFGFRELPDGSVTLKCSPEHEARTYETGAIHKTWDDLAKLTVPTWVISGVELNQSPSSIAPKIAAAIPGSHFARYNDLAHFGPMQDPVRFAAIIRQAGAH
ncbi:MAG: alpha/beta fold hydrolase [Ilumatobacteraceae bacterium]